MEYVNTITQAQAAYQFFKISCDNSEHLNALEARLIKQLGENSAAQMKQLISVLAVQDSTSNSDLLPDVGARSIR